MHVVCERVLKRGTHLEFKTTKMLKKISLALLNIIVKHTWKHNFKNAEALLLLFGLCSKDEKLLMFLSS